MDLLSSSRGYYLHPHSPQLWIIAYSVAVVSASVHAGFDPAIGMVGNGGSNRKEGERSGNAFGGVAFEKFESHRPFTPASSLLSPPYPQSGCIEIPTNFTLCHGMQYTRMHLPNLLDHESIDEALEQSEAWNSLLRLHCHPDAQLFLCSLFAPICLEEMTANHQPPHPPMKIQPCQSLCLAVKGACEERIQQYGFPWPEMLRCSKFPPDNDMCIRVPSLSEQSGQPLSQMATEQVHRSSGTDGGAKSGGPKTKMATCASCSQVSTFENLMDSYCRSAVVFKGRLRRLNSTHAEVIKRTRLFKGELNKAKHSNALLRLSQTVEPCACPVLLEREGGDASSGENTNYLVMIGAGNREVLKYNGGGSRTATASLIMPWKPKNDKSFKTAVRRFRKLNCQTLGREIRESMLAANGRRRRPFRRTIF